MKVIKTETKIEGLIIKIISATTQRLLCTLVHAAASLHSKSNTGLFGFDFLSRLLHRKHISDKIYSNEKLPWDLL